MSSEKKSNGVSSSPIDVDSIALIDDSEKAPNSNVPAKGNAISSASAKKAPVTRKKKVAIAKTENKLTEDDLRRVNTSKGLITLLKNKDIKIKDAIADLEYEEELERLQVELVKLQRWVQEKGKRVAIILEGRDAAGKGGTIRRFTEHLNPRSMRVVALPKPSQQERGQWYFQRYSVQLPNAGEIVFFDRSWYNRAVVEPVNGFCTKVEYQRFIQQVPEFEHMLYEDGITIIKFWFSISKEEQSKRFESRQSNPLKQWKLSPIDQQAQDLWNSYTSHKEEMFSRSHMSFSPWIVVKANDKRMARLESIRYVLHLLDYTGKSDAKVRLYPDPNIVNRYHRQIPNID
ncbi:hypothetical protein BH11CYA1_BH11CYA1_28760 [soil metagenome]